MDDRKTCHARHGDDVTVPDGAQLDETEIKVGDGKVAKVVEMDWRTVTLVTTGGDRVVVANSTLAKGNLTIAARAKEKATVTVPLTLGVNVPPERVREARRQAIRPLNRGLRVVA